ncbi:MAG: hypothetical protein U5O39_20720 [Gammaproteobacteria bacterium]|nr:hypothetical protein [Gammaproteobacteria bacterium]
MIDPETGDLIFMPAPGASGQTEVAVTLFDDGAVETNDGCTGNLTSLPQSVSRFDILQ